MGNAVEKAKSRAEALREHADEEHRDDVHFFNFPGRYNWAATALESCVHFLVTQPPKIIPALSDMDLHTAIVNKFPDMDTNLLNIGVMGGSGAGKLSLINAFRGIPRSVSAAKEDQEEGRIPIQLTHPTYDHIRLWYLPDNYGDEGVPDENYFHDNCLYAFDLILFVGGNKIRPGDIELAKQSYFKQPFTATAFIRSKIDGDLIFRIGRVAGVKEWELEKDKVTGRIRSMLERQVEPAQLNEPPIWLISQGGILDILDIENNDFRYVVDDFHPLIYLAQIIEKFRFDEGGEAKEDEIIERYKSDVGVHAEAEGEAEDEEHHEPGEEHKEQKEHDLYEEHHEPEHEHKEAEVEGE